MNNDYINWPGDEPQDSEKQGVEIGNITMRENDTPPPIPIQNNSSYNHEWWINRKYRDNDGIELNAIGLILLAAAVVLLWHEPRYVILIICLAANVLLHECGHYAAGRMFRCVVRRVAVFFVPAISYKNKATSSYNPDTHSWRDTVWTLGVIPFGGYTTFESAKSPAPDDPRLSPFINHKPAWQRLIINTAGILVNLATFFVCFAINGFSFTVIGNHWLSTMMYMSLSLSILNLLPLYPLDGSAAITSIYEICTGKAPSKTFMTIFKTVGVALFIYLFWINPSFLNNLIAMIIGR